MGEHTNKSGVVFIVGTEQEAAAIAEQGHEALSAWSVEDVASLALELEGRGAYAIVHLNEESTAEYVGALREAGVPYHVASGMYGEGRGLALEMWASLEADKAEARMGEAREQANREVLERLGVHDVLGVALQIAAGEADRERIPTGLETLDKALGGGLPEGAMVTMGATSSSGKTTLSLQFADHMAAAGRAVLFVTIEQGRHELVAKSLSRLMRLQPKRHGWFSVGAAGIQSAKEREAWDRETREAFDGACAEYASTIAPNLYVMEADKQPTTADVRKAAEAIRRQRGKAPVVFVDYLQLLAPASERLTDKAAVDRNVMDLRHLARDMQTCVFVISSLNRSSYSTGVTMEGFKESGSVEYGSDVLLGMQPKGLAERLEGVSEAKQKAEARAVEREFKRATNREVVVTVLKNRGGAVHPDGIPLQYSAVSNLFTCAEAGEAKSKPAFKRPK